MMNNKGGKFNILTVIVVTVISVLGIFQRFEFREKKDFWGDETVHIRHSVGSFERLIKYARDIIQFPGDSLLIRFSTKFFGESKWSLAAPRLFIAVIGFFLLYVLCSLYFKTIVGYIVTFLIVSFNGILINHSLEIRPYGVLAVLAIACFLVTRYIVQEKKLSIFKKFLVSVFIFLIMLYHLYCVLLLLFPYLFHLFYSRKEETLRDVLVRNLKDFLFAVIVAIPLWCYFAFGPKPAVHTSKSVIFDYIGSDIISFLKGMVGNLLGNRIFYVILLGIPFPFLFPVSNRGAQIFYFLLIIIIPIGLILLSCIMYNYYFVPRLFVWAIPFFAFQLGWYWDSAVSYFITKRV